MLEARKTCVWLTARGSFSVPLNAPLSGGAAVLRDTLDAASRTLNGSLRGGRRVLNRATGGAPEQANAADRE